MRRRLVLSLGLGTFATLVVLFAMQALVATEGREPEDPDRPAPEIFIPEEDPPPPPPGPLGPPPTPTPPEDPPDLPDDGLVLSEVIDEGIGPPIVVPPVPPDPGPVDPFLLPPDGECLPIAEIPATYPILAHKRGIEGYCTVEYTVTATGSVKDVVVIEAEPEGFFEKASIEAARKFKYKPRVVNGKPIECGKRKRFKFTLED